jgi:hypothetical protein
VKRSVLLGILTILLTLVVAGSALGATSPQAIYDDYAANGTFKGVYTADELQAFLNNAPADTYANPVVLANARNLATQVLALMKQGKTFEAALKEVSEGRGTFPWTGAELALLILGGAALVGSGFLLQRRTR